jgi:hypothetical protein
MKIVNTFKSLCLPSKVYFVLAIIAMLISIFGSASLLFHLFHLVYIVFWTWILHLICKEGYKWLSWVLVVTPYIIAFIIAFYIVNNNTGVDYESTGPIIVLSK